MTELLAFALIALAIVIFVVIWVVIADAVARAVDRKIEALTDKDHEMMQGGPL